MQTLTFAAHTAHIDPMTGTGLLVLPSPEDDLPCVAPTTALLPDGSGGTMTGLVSDSLNESDFNATVSSLDAIGFEPLLDDDEMWCFEGVTEDGRDVISLFGRNPIVSKPSLEEINDSLMALRKLANVKQREPSD